MGQSLSAQFVNLLAAMLLLLAFAMLSQRRVLTLIHLFAWQGAALAASTLIVAYSTGQTHLYFSGALTVLLKVMLIPWVLHRLIDQLQVRWDVETLINIPATMLIGIVLVIFAFALAAPISEMANTLTRATLGIAMASILLPYYTLAKLFHKDAVVARNASPLFHLTPYVLFGCMWLAAGIVPVLATGLPFAPAADIIALVGVFALARVFSALAAMDIGTSFGGLGARREMLIGFLAEPAMLMTLFTAAFISGSTQLTTIVETLAHREFAIYPSLAFAAVAFFMVLLAENARIPIDNPATHLELTMVHEAMILEYSARHLALIEWAVAIKLFAYISIGIALFLPWGIAGAGDWAALPVAVAALAAKLRLFLAPEFLSAAFLLAVLGMLTHFLVRG